MVQSKRCHSLTVFSLPISAMFDLMALVLSFWNGRVSDRGQLCSLSKIFYHWQCQYVPLLSFSVVLEINSISVIPIDMVSFELKACGDKWTNIVDIWSSLTVHWFDDQLEIFLHIFRVLHKNFIEWKIRWNKTKNVRLISYGNNGFAVRVGVPWFFVKF